MPKKPVYDASQIQVLGDIGGIRTRPNEVWKAVPGYEGEYEVSTLGRVRSVARVISMQNGTHRCCAGKVLTHTMNGPSYYHKVSLSKSLRGKRVGRTGQKQHYVHVLVLTAFVGPQPAGLVARHLDGNIDNNTLKNLRYGTPKQNGQDKVRHGTSPVGSRNPASILTEQDVVSIRLALKGGRCGVKTLARRYGVSATTVRDAASGKTWKHLTERKG